jgi:hypothetical protein
MTDDLAAATRVVVDAAIGGLHCQTPGRRAGHDRVKAPPLVVDLDDVARLNAL